MNQKIMEMVDRSKAPVIEGIKNIKYGIPEKYTLDNGIDLYTLVSDSSEVIKMDIIFKAGTEFQSEKLSAVFANSLIKESPVGMQADEVAEVFDYYGSYTESFVNIDNAGIRLFVTNNFINDILSVFSSLIKNPDLPVKEFEILKNKYLQTLKNNLEKTRYLAMTGLNTELFGTDNPRGDIVRPEDILNVNLNDIRKFVDSYYKANNCYIILSGMINESTINQINKYFGENNMHEKWNDNGLIKKPTFMISESSENFKLIETKNPVQSTICIGKNFGGLNDKELVDIGIVSTLLGGYFGSRLMKNVREDKGYTYGINSFIVEYPGSVCLKIISDVGVSVTKSAIDEIFYEINELRNKLVSPAELKIMKNYMLGELMSAFDGVFSLSEVWQKLISSGKDSSFIDLQIERIKNITPHDIKYYAGKFLGNDGFHTIVGGGMG